MNRIRIRQGQLIDANGDPGKRSDLFVAGGEIVGIGEAPDGFTADRSIDASGCLVLPGLVDLSVHLREPGADHKASIDSESRAAAAGGITRMLASPATDPICDTPAVVELVTRRARQTQCTRVMPAGALTRGLAGELLTEVSALKAAGCVALSDGGRPVRNALVLRRALDYAATCGLPVILSAFDPDLMAGSRMHEGWVSARLGIPGSPVAAETAALARGLALAEESGAHVHFARLSTARGAEILARARRDGLPVSADVAMHQLFLTEMDVSGFNSQCHVVPPLRSHADREALRQAVADGTIQAICSDHQPHDADAKAVPFVASEPGISAVDSLLPLALRLVDEGLLTLPQLAARLCRGPAEVLGLSCGLLEVGRPADLCIVDPEIPWWHGPGTMRSHGENSPFIGWEFSGRARYTLLGGRLIHAAEPAGMKTG
ncbi:dihydroorotase [Methylonatrum kenyense]|uniref:dihydroorotase n=1 Tax=Methylonatrum kenyense TaxID=455253 RepID=UPI0020BED4D3|nr:dihydroorotase [Methylonatrum kenyense]MCK8516641.1 dihydroorotase [Methylonatrum kenyense]